MMDLHVVVFADVLHAVCFGTCTGFRCANVAIVKSTMHCRSGSVVLACDMASACGSASGF